MSDCCDDRGRCKSCKHLTRTLPFKTANGLKYIRVCINPACVRYYKRHR